MDGNALISTYAPTTHKIHPPHKINVLYTVNSNNVYHYDAILKKEKQQKTKKQIEADSTILNAITHGDKFLSHCNKFERTEIEQILLEYKLQEEHEKQSTLYTQCSTQQNIMIREQNTSSEYMIEEIKEEPPSYRHLCTPIFKEHNYSLYNTQVQHHEETEEEYNIPLLQRILNSTSGEKTSKALMCIQKKFHHFTIYTKTKQIWCMIIISRSSKVLLKKQ